MANEPEEHVIFGVGTQFWYDEEAIRLLQNGCPIGDYAGRHACGDPGEAAVTPEEVMSHAIQCAEEKGDITSAYLLPDGRHLCFTTVQEKATTYIYVK